MPSVCICLLIGHAFAENINQWMSHTNHSSQDIKSTISPIHFAAIVQSSNRQENHPSDQSNNQSINQSCSNDFDLHTCNLQVLGKVACILRVTHKPARSHFILGDKLSTKFDRLQTCCNQRAERTKLLQDTTGILNSYSDTQQAQSPFLPLGFRAKNRFCSRLWRFPLWLRIHVAWKGRHHCTA